MGRVDFREFVGYLGGKIKASPALTVIRKSN